MAMPGVFYNPLGVQHPTTHKKAPKTRVAAPHQASSGSRQASLRDASPSPSPSRAPYSPGSPSIRKPTPALFRSKNTALALAALAGAEAVKEVKDESKLVNVRLSIPYRVSFGEVMKVVGSSADLGSWNPAAAPAMQWSDNDIWVGDMMLSPGVYEFKAVVYNATTKKAVWEGQQGNRRIEVPEEPGQLLVPCTWGSAEVKTSFVAAEDATAVANRLPVASAGLIGPAANRPGRTAPFVPDAAAAIAAAATRAAAAPAPALASAKRVPSPMISSITSGIKPVARTADAKPAAPSPATSTPSSISATVKTNATKVLSAAELNGAPTGTLTPQGRAAAPVPHRSPSPSPVPAVTKYKTTPRAEGTAWLKEMAQFEGPILGLIAAHGTLPLDRLHKIIRINTQNTNQKFDKTEDMLAVYMSQLVAQGKCAMDPLTGVYKHPGGGLARAPTPQPRPGPVTASPPPPAVRSSSPVPPSITPSSMTSTLAAAAAPASASPVQVPAQLPPVVQTSTAVPAPPPGSTVLRAVGKSPSPERSITPTIARGPPQVFIDPKLDPKSAAEARARAEAEIRWKQQIAERAAREAAVRQAEEAEKARYMAEAEAAALRKLEEERKAALAKTEAVKARKEAEAKEKAEAEAKIKAEAAAKAKAEADAQANQQAQAKAEAEAQAAAAKAEAERKRKAEADALQAMSESKVKEEKEEKTRLDADAATEGKTEPLLKLAEAQRSEASPEVTKADAAADKAGPSEAEMRASLERELRAMLQAEMKLELAREREMARKQYEEEEAKRKALEDELTRVRKEQEAAKNKMQAELVNLKEERSTMEEELKEQEKVAAVAKAAAEEAKQALEEEERIALAEASAKAQAEEEKAAKVAAEAKELEERLLAKLEKTRLEEEEARRRAEAAEHESKVRAAAAEAAERAAAEKAASALKAREAAEKAAAAAVVAAAAPRRSSERPAGAPTPSREGLDQGVDVRTYGVLASASTAPRDPYEQQVVNVLSSFSALPLERLHNIIKFTSTDASQVKSVPELETFCVQLVEKGVLYRDSRGWFSYKRDGLYDVTTVVTPARSVVPAVPVNGFTVIKSGSTPQPARGMSSATSSSSQSARDRVPPTRPPVRAGTPIPVAARVPTPRPSGAAYPGNLSDFAPYEAQILGLLANFQSMPVERLKSVLELTMISPKFTKSVTELESFLEWLADKGQISRDLRNAGWYSYFKPGRTPKAAAVSSPSPAPAAVAAPATAVPTHVEPAMQEGAPIWMPSSPHARAAARENDMRTRAPTPAAIRIRDDPPVIASAPSPTAVLDVARSLESDGLLTRDAMTSTGSATSATTSDGTPNTDETAVVGTPNTDQRAALITVLALTSFLAFGYVRQSQMAVLPSLQAPTVQQLSAAHQAMSDAATSLLEDATDAFSSTASDLRDAASTAAGAIREVVDDASQTIITRK